MPGGAPVGGAFLLAAHGLRGAQEQVGVGDVQQAHGPVEEGVVPPEHVDRVQHRRTTAHDHTAEPGVEVGVVPELVGEDATELRDGQADEERQPEVHAAPAGQQAQQAALLGDTGVDVRIEVELVGRPLPRRPGGRPDEVPQLGLVLRPHRDRVPFRLQAPCPQEGEHALQDRHGHHHRAGHQRRRGPLRAVDEHSCHQQPVQHCHGRQQHEPHQEEARQQHERAQHAQPESHRSPPTGPAAPPNPRRGPTTRGSYRRVNPRGRQ
ncbi:hypothetical protein OG387_22500 [Streptomyces longwoodensis]